MVILGYYKTRLEPCGPWVPVVLKRERLPERPDRDVMYVNGRPWNGEYQWRHIQVIDDPLDARCHIRKGYVRRSDHDEYRRLLSMAAQAPEMLK